MITTRNRGAVRARRGGILAGCLVVLGVFLLLVIGGGIYVASHWRGWSADWFVQACEAVLDKSELSAEQQSEIMAEVQVLADDFEAGNVSLQELGRIAEELRDSPVIPVAAVYAARKGYFEDSGLSDEEKANADLQMQRLARGVFEKKISMDEMQDAVDQIAVQTRENQWEIREPDVVTDKDLREMVEKITVLADEKEIPAEPFEVDVAREVREAIARGRGNAPEPKALPAPEQTPDDADAGAGADDGSGDAEPDGAEGDAGEGGG